MHQHQKFQKSSYLIHFLQFSRHNTSFSFSFKYDSFRRGTHVNLQLLVAIERLGNPGLPTNCCFSRALSWAFLQSLTTGNCPRIWVITNAKLKIHILIQIFFPGDFVELFVKSSLFFLFLQKTGLSLFCEISFLFKNFKFFKYQHSRILSKGVGQTGMIDDE